MLNESVPLKNGVNLIFLRNDYPLSENQNVVIDLVALRNIQTYENFVAYCQDISRLKHFFLNANIIIWNNGGSWLKCASFAVRAGFENIYLYQQPKYNEILTSTRVVIHPEEVSVCFLPNYKCGYSSMWRFFRKNYPSCASKGMETHSLNSKEDLLAKKYIFKFSFIRDPVSRLRSFYIDKFCREVEHHNNVDYKKVYEELLGTEELDPFDVVNFVGSIPSDFSDRHWKSSYDNIFFNEQPLVDKVYDIKSTDVFLRDIREYAPKSLEMPKANKTSKYDVSDIRDVFASEEMKILVNNSFSRDAGLYKELIKNGGSLSF